MQTENVINGLKTYSGRDACIRVIAYFGMFMYGVLDLAVKHFKSNAADENDRDDDSTPFYFYLFTFISIENLVHLAASCRVISKQFSTTRLITRFFDDIPAVYNLVEFWAKNFPDEPPVQQKPVKLFLNWLTVFNLIFWVLYNPFEHIAYLGELNVIDVEHNDYYNYTNASWVGALGTSVLLNLRLVIVYYYQHYTKAKHEDNPNFDKSELVSQSDMKKSLFIGFRDFFDLVIAVNYLPESWLPWEGKLIHYQIGLLGVISSLLRIKQYVLY